MSQLAIYKASAGSGKTFKLTGEYLMLLFKYPRNYRRILAVTFTNKATAEMKSRILSELYKLGKRGESDYLQELKEAYGLSESEIQAKAAKILSSLLHDFSKFSVSTIDTFFQKIIRSFTREMGIQPGYTIELNQNEVLSKVIDELLVELDENKSLLKWISDLASDSIEQGNKWDFKEDILKLASEIFKESYKSFKLPLNKKINDKNFLKEYIGKLQKIKATFENFMQTKAGEAIELIQQHGLTIDDFSRKKGGPAGYFYKITEKGEFAPGKLFIDAKEESAKWYTKSSDQKDAIETLLNHGLLILSQEIYAYYENNKIAYYTSVEILKHIHSLGILTDISNKLRAYCEEHNIFLISDAAELLQVIIDQNDSPFIYEKTGSIYRHFMIDEFQDTSKIQWHNFRPLIGNSLAQGSRNLVVGDIKQSIYRWRNSDWKILAEHIQNEFSQYHPEEQSLNTNWRSTKNIVDYNNAIFCYSSQILQNSFNGVFEDQNSSNNPYKEKITEAYKDVFQQVPSQSNQEVGYIKHTFLNEKEYDSWKDEVKTRLPNIIENLQKNGHQLKDIAILVRSGKEGQEIANTLIEHKKENSTSAFDFISNDSLYLANSSVIRFLIALLEYILNPEDEINLSFIAYEYNQYLQAGKMDQNRLHNLLKNHLTDEDNQELRHLFPKEFIEQIGQIKQLPLYELIDKLIRIFELNTIKAEIPYIKAFLDIILHFSKTSTSDIHSFLNWWNEEGIKKTLSVSENQNAIRIITIHKSKGLEFKNVIIPFCNWPVDHRSNQNNILWCTTSEEPFSKLEPIPLKYVSNLTETVFKEDYLNEKFHAYVDNLNLLYVAFTRAAENLFCFSPRKDKVNKISNVGNLLLSVYEKYADFPSENTLLDLGRYWNPDENRFEFGTINPAEKEKKVLPEEFELTEFQSYDIKNKLRLKMHDNSFFTGEKNAPFEKINHGKVMHEVFENIQTEDDIPTAVNQLIFEGKVAENEKSELIQKIIKTLENEQIKMWFSKQWQVKTEAEIILPNGKTIRPDRVISNNEETIVIDYKFGELEEPKHNKQVKIYMETLQKMEAKTVEGYLWYVDLGKVIRVE
ncbi:MAG: UvrD-helicase domain-containing protein [Bacteroidetes bacterium]|nr:UvrD-helicase domain-containing protein [Bacteroidota bacterium]